MFNDLAFERQCYALTMHTLKSALKALRRNKDRTEKIINIQKQMMESLHSVVEDIVDECSRALLITPEGEEDE